MSNNFNNEDINLYDRKRNELENSIQTINDKIKVFQDKNIEMNIEKIRKIVDDIKNNTENIKIKVKEAESKKIEKKGSQ